MSNKADFLVELGTEELPPKALAKLSKAFSDNLVESLEKAGVTFGVIENFASPRRLAVKISSVLLKQEDKEVERKGPAVNAAFKEDGCPTPAAEGFARSCGVSVDELEKTETDKGAWLVFKSSVKGEETKNLLPTMVEEALAKLPIPKRMRWGERQTQFVRPVHWLVMLLGEDVIDCSVLGLKAGRTSKGHRFHHPEPIELPNPSDYESLLELKGHVLANFEKRREAIKAQVEQAALKVDGVAVIDEALLDEVTGLVEWPNAILGNFDEKFLEIPSEALVSAMKGHQKYFHVVKDDELLPCFITVSNIDSKNPETVKQGNERVIRPRLSDADFFWNTDRKTPLNAELQKLKTVVFQNKLGTLYDKTTRVMGLAEAIAKELGVNVRLAVRAAELSKCDLMTEMVGEFPELQGIMGRYYALHDKEEPQVAEAILEHYMPRFAGDNLPPSNVGQIVSLADKLDTLVGIFSIGQVPTGDKDPFALRRATLGILRIMIEKSLSLDLDELLTIVAKQYSLKNNEVVGLVYDFMMDRLKGYYHEQGYRPQVFEAVLATRPTIPVNFDARMNSVALFEKSPDAEALAAANKRISNILRKNKEQLPSNVDINLFEEEQEKLLYSRLAELESSVNVLVEKQDYDQALKLLSQLKEPIDAFFDHVMVMTDAKAVRLNRLAMLSKLYQQFSRIADISKLS